MKKEKMLEIKSWRDDARRGLNREKDLILERSEDVNAYDHVFDAVDDLISDNDDLADEVERQQQEIDDLNEQLEQKEQEIDDLRRQLLEARNQHLEAENQHLEAEVHAKPLEIHNHFESGSNSQVCNDKVNGRFTRKQNDKKKNKKRWKKIVRKM